MGAEASRDMMITQRPEPSVSTTGEGSLMAEVYSIMIDKVGHRMLNPSIRQIQKTNFSYWGRDHQLWLTIAISVKKHFFLRRESSRIIVNWDLFKRSNCHLAKIKWLQIEFHHIDIASEPTPMAVSSGTETATPVAINNSARYIDLRNEFLKLNPRDAVNMLAEFSRGSGASPLIAQMREMLKREDKRIELMPLQYIKYCYNSSNGTRLTTSKARALGRTSFSNVNVDFALHLAEYVTFVKRCIDGPVEAHKMSSSQLDLLFCSCHLEHKYNLLLAFKGSKLAIEKELSHLDRDDYHMSFKEKFEITSFHSPNNLEHYKIAMLSLYDPASMNNKERGLFLTNMGYFRSLRMDIKDNIARISNRYTIGGSWKTPHDVYEEMLENYSRPPTYRMFTQSVMRKMEKSVADSSKMSHLLNGWVINMYTKPNMVVSFENPSQYLTKGRKINSDLSCDRYRSRMATIIGGISDLSNIKAQAFHRMDMLVHRDIKMDGLFMPKDDCDRNIYNMFCIQWYLYNSLKCSDDLGEDMGEVEPEGNLEPMIRISISNIVREFPHLEFVLSVCDKKHSRQEIMQCCAMLVKTASGEMGSKMPNMTCVKLPSHQSSNLLQRVDISIDQSLETIENVEYCEILLNHVITLKFDYFRQRTGYMYIQNDDVNLFIPLSIPVLRKFLQARKSLMNYKPGLAAPPRIPFTEPLPSKDNCYVARFSYESTDIQRKLIDISLIDLSNIAVADLFNKLANDEFESTNNCRYHMMSLNIRTSPGPMEVKVISDDYVPSGINDLLEDYEHEIVGSLEGKFFALKIESSVPEELGEDIDACGYFYRFALIAGFNCERSTMNNYWYKTVNFKILKISYEHMCQEMGRHTPKFRFIYNCKRVTEETRTETEIRRSLLLLSTNNPEQSFATRLIHFKVENRNGGQMVTEIRDRFKELDEETTSGLESWFPEGDKDRSIKMTLNEFIRIFPILLMCHKPFIGSFTTENYVTRISAISNCLSIVLATMSADEVAARVIEGVAYRVDMAKQLLPTTDSLPSIITSIACFCKSKLTYFSRCEETIKERLRDLESTLQSRYLDETHITSRSQFKRKREVDDNPVGPTPSGPSRKDDENSSSSELDE